MRIKLDGSIFVLSWTAIKTGTKRRYNIGYGYLSYKKRVPKIK